MFFRKLFKKTLSDQVEEDGGTKSSESIEKQMKKLALSGTPTGHGKRGSSMTGNTSGHVDDYCVKLSQVILSMQTADSASSMAFITAKAVTDCAGHFFSTSERLWLTSSIPNVPFPTL